MSEESEKLSKQDIRDMRSDSAPWSRLMYAYTDMMWASSFGRREAMEQAKTDYETAREDMDDLWESSWETALKEVQR